MTAGPGRGRNGGQRGDGDRPGQAESQRDPRELREEIERTRMEVAETIDALAGRADVRAQGRERVRHATSRAKERLADTTESVRYKGEQLTNRAGEQLGHGQERVREVLPDQAEEWARQATDVARRNKRALAYGAAALLALRGLSRVRRRRRVRRQRRRRDDG